MSTTNTLPSFVHAIGGSIGSALAVLVFYPLERVRVELQSSTAQSADEDVKVVQSMAPQSTDREAYITETLTSLLNDNHPDIQIEQEERSSTPASSNDSFELVHHPVLSYSDESSEKKEPLLEIDIPILQSESAQNADQKDIPVSAASPMPNNTNETRDHSTQKEPLLEIDIPILQSESAQNADQKDTTASAASPILNNTNETRDHLTSESILQCLLRLHRQNSLYKGASHMITTLMISNFIFFYALQICRRSLSYIQDKQNSRQQHRKRLCTPRSYVLPRLLQTTLQSKMASSLFSSTFAGIINVLLTNPLWVASLRIMEDKVPCASDGNRALSLWSVIHSIAKSEGIQQLWGGTWTSMLLVSNPIIQHATYEQMRSRLLQVKRRQLYNRGMPLHTSLSPLEAFVFGATAKAVATVLTYPLQLAQVLLRLQSKHTENSDKDRTQDQQNSIAYTGTYDCLQRQFSQGGISALFVGMNAKLLQTVLTSAFTFLTYEQILVLVARIYESIK